MNVIDPDGGTVVVRVLEPLLWLRGRRLGRHSQHRGLVQLALPDAIRLVESRQAQAPAGHTLREMREAAAQHST